jgi:hypothetical protein
MRGLQKATSICIDGMAGNLAGVTLKKMVERPGETHIRRAYVKPKKWATKRLASA